MSSDPSKESDVYSLAMTTYEVRSSHPRRAQPSLKLSLCYKTLTEVLPYGNTRDGIITFHVVSGDRPPRPASARWLQDHIWDMITACWSEDREQRWDVGAMYNKLSTSSVQEVLDAEPGNRRVSPNDID